MSPIPVSPHSGQLSLSTMERDRSLPPENPPGQLTGGEEEQVIRLAQELEK